MYTYTLAVDESGDVSMSFRKGASRYFAMALIASANPDQLRNVLARVRKEAHVSPSYEFKYHSLTSTQLRRSVFSALHGADFSAWGVVADKTSLQADFHEMKRMDFYLYFATRLLSSIPSRLLAGSSLILDEFGSPMTIKTSLRQALYSYGVKAGPKRITISRSRSESLIQVADLVAGSILRRDPQDDADTYDFISSKIKDVWEIS